MARLNEEEIDAALAGLDGWQRDHQVIRREYDLDSFAEAIALVNEVARMAEALDHHPDIDIRYDRVRLSLSTHSAGGLTSRDFELARRIDEHRAGRSGA